ncbi:MAG: hypothetical protein KME06_20490 [Kastovskya adunca ATA6-11-RM4]|nr:hypothetical protein [Kastovskya adunca ATA6-11-RM4]
MKISRLIRTESGINQLHILAIAVVGLILTLPTFFYNVFDAHDILFHLNWAQYFAEQFWQGDFYPRWLQDMNSGLGSPTFFFYAPIPYYITSFFHPLAFNTPEVWFPLCFSASLSLIASGIAAYFWLGTITTTNRAALLAALVYMALPYHLVIDLYIRFAFTEYWAFVWMPLILYFSQKISKGQKLAIPGLAISYALLIMTHLPTTLIFSPIFPCYILVITKRRRLKDAVIYGGLAMVLGIGLAAIYLLPALLMQDYVAIKDIASRPYFYFANSFLFTINKTGAVSLRNYLSFTLILQIGLAVCALLTSQNNPKLSVKREVVFWLTVAGVSFLMTTPLSHLIWQQLLIIQKIQFPWRFNVATTLAITALLALGIDSVKHPLKLLSQRSSAVGFALLIILLASGFVVTYTYTKPLVFDSETLIMMSRDASEYKPKWVTAGLFDNASIIRQLGRNLPPAQISTGEGSVAVKQWSPRSIIVQTSTNTDAVLTLRQFYYPGWTAKLKGQSVTLPTNPSEITGLLNITVPKGEQEVNVKLAAGGVERAGQVISGICALITFLLYFQLNKSDRFSRE